MSKALHPRKHPNQIMMVRHSTSNTHTKKHRQYESKFLTVAAFIALSAEHDVGQDDGDDAEGDDEGGNEYGE